MKEKTNENELKGEVLLGLSLPVIIVGIVFAVLFSSLSKK
jgi:hypothetical protein